MNKPLVAQVPLFAALPATELHHLLTKAQRIEVPADTLLIHEGEHGDHFYIILAGELDLIKALGTTDER